MAATEEELETQSDFESSEEQANGAEGGEELQFDTTSNLRLEAKKFVIQALLDKASMVLPTKDIMPVLKNFRIEAVNGEVRVVATDLELSVLATTQMVAIKEEGSAVFPGKRLLELVREADDGDMILEVEKGKATIRVGKAEWELMLMDGSEYPPLPEVDELEFHDLDRSKFLQAIGQVRWAAADDTVRPNLMMLDVSGGKMRAADGVRFQQIPVESSLDFQIPIGAVDDLVRLLRTTEQNIIGVADAENHLVFRIAADVFIANKLAAVFPDVENLLLRPALANDQELRVDREDFFATIKRVRVTADPETSAIIVDLTESDKLMLKSRDKYGNQAKETLDVVWKGESREVALNHVYLLEMLQMHDGKTCNFFLGPDTKTRKSPLMLKDEETGLVGILNQLRIEFVS